jgi:hypothetical protein
MKKTLLLLSVLITFVVLLSSFGGGDPNSDYPTGAPAGYTGSPADGNNCTACHGGTPTTAAGLITSNIPASGYVPGTTYTITATSPGSGNKGFEISPQNTAGTLLGTLTAGSNNHITGTKYVTHNASNTANPAVWTFTWTAPAAGTGSVTFYGAFAITTSTTKVTTLTVNEATSPSLTAAATANPTSVVAGGTSQLNVTATGGSGTYTYSWTSVPAGFTSTAQNPVVTPSVTTVYTVIVTSGSQTASSSATVTVTPLLTATASANPASIIAGGSSQLNVTAGGGTGSFTYSWTSVPAGFTSTAQNPVVTPTVTTVYTVHVVSGTQSVNSSATVTVTPLLTATASANPASIIAGGSSQLNVTAGGGTGSFSYSWTSVPAGFTSTAQNPVVTPTVTTVYTVHVVSGTQSVNSSATVTVTPVLTATASANPASIIAGGSSQLNVVASGGTGSFTYSWTSVPAGFTSTAQNPSVSPTVTTVYTVQVTSGTQTVSSSATVTVGAGLSATASANPASIIAGGSSQLNVSASGGAGSYTYSWTSVPAGFISTAQNPTVSPTVTTVYTVQVTSGTQTVSSSATVTVIPVLTATASANPASIIAGGSSQLNVVASGGTGSFTYSWTSVPAGFTSSAQNPTVSPAVTTVYTVQVTSGTQTVSSSATVTVGAGLSATASANPTTISSGGSSQLNVIASGGTGSYAYSWTSVPSGFTSTLQNPVVSPTVTTAYTVQVTSGAQVVSSGVTVTVTSSTPLSVTAAANPATIIQGGSSQLSASAAGGTGSFTYAWSSVPAGFSSTAQNPVVSPNVSTVYTVVVTSGSATASASASVSVIPQLVVTATANPATITSGGSSQLNAAASGGTGSYSYSWTSNPSGFTSNIQNPVVSPTTTTTYTVTVISGAQTKTSSVQVTVTTSGGKLRVRAYAKPSHIEEGERSHLYATASGGNGNYSYHWTSQPAGFTSNQQNPIVRPHVTTKYTVVVTSGSKTGSASVTVYVEEEEGGGDGSVIARESSGNETPDPESLKLLPTGSGDAAQPVTKVLVAPNPCSEQFRITVNGEVKGNATVSVMDINGKVVRREVMSPMDLQNRIFDVSTYPKGVYVISIQSDNLLKTVKLIVQ